MSRHTVTGYHYRNSSQANRTHVHSQQKEAVLLLNMGLNTSSKDFLPFAEQIRVAPAAATSQSFLRNMDNAAARGIGGFALIQTQEGAPWRSRVAVWRASIIAIALPCARPGRTQGRALRGELVIRQVLHASAPCFA
jgi:hypothetical protein